MITSADVSKALQVISEYLPEQLRAEIKFELQDDSNFILISVLLTEYAFKSDLAARRKWLERAATVMDSCFPARDGDYRWMLCFLKDKEVLNAASGGWSRMPIAIS